MNRATPRRAVALVALSALAAIVACGGAASQSSVAMGDGRYRIALDRPWVEGFEWTETVRHREAKQMQIVVGGQVAQAERELVSLELSASYRVITARPVRLAMHVESFTVDRGEGPTAVTVPADVIVTRGSVEAASSAVSDPGAMALLGKVALLQSGGADDSEHDDDRIFGTPEPQVIGAAWPIDTNLAAAQLGDSLPVRGDQLGGQTQLVALEPIDGEDCLRLRTAIQAHGITPPNVPPNAELRRGDMDARFEGWLPLDPSLPPLRERTSMQFDIDLAFTTPNGPGQVTMAMTYDQERSRSLRR